jgi:hypothetical protein
MTSDTWWEEPVEATFPYWVDYQESDGDPTVEAEDAFFGKLLDHQILLQMTGGSEDFYYFGSDEMVVNHEEDGAPMIQTLNGQNQTTSDEDSIDN